MAHFNFQELQRTSHPPFLMVRRFFCTFPSFFGGLLYFYPFCSVLFLFGGNKVTSGEWVPLKWPKSSLRSTKEAVTLIAEPIVGVGSVPTLYYYFHHSNGWWHIPKFWLVVIYIQYGYNSVIPIVIGEIS